MEMTICPHCRDRVARSTDGKCPSCHRSIAVVPDSSIEVTENPYQLPSETAASTTIADGMTIGEQVYSAIVILCAGFFLTCLVWFHFMVIPRLDDPGILYFVVFMSWVYVLALGATAAVNLYYRSLLIIPTIVQCVVLGITGYLLPFAIWGGVLLYRRLERANRRRQAMGL